MQPAACSLDMPVYASNMAGALQESVVDVQVLPAFPPGWHSSHVPLPPPPPPRRKPPAGISNFHPISHLSGFL